MELTTGFGNVLVSLDNLKKRLLQAEFLGSIDNQLFAVLYGYNYELDKYVPNIKTKGFESLKEISEVASDACQRVEQAIMSAIKKTRNKDCKALTGYSRKELYEIIRGPVDYETYTYKNYHRKFWNEIELPPIVLSLFNGTVELAGLTHKDSSNFVVDLYDMSGESIWFDTLEDMETFLGEEDVTPYTAFEIMENQCFELYSA